MGNLSARLRGLLTRPDSVHAVDAAGGVEERDADRVAGRVRIEVHGTGLVVGVREDDGARGSELLQAVRHRASVGFDLLRYESGASRVTFDDRDLRAVVADRHFIVAHFRFRSALFPAAEEEWQRDDAERAQRSPQEWRVVPRVRAAWR